MHVEENRRVEKLLEDLKTVVRDGEELLRGGAEDLREKAVEGARRTRGYVREHPYHSAGLLLGLGVVVGVIAAVVMRNKTARQQAEFIEEELHQG